MKYHQRWPRILPMIPSTSNSALKPTMELMSLSRTAALSNPLFHFSWQDSTQQTAAVTTDYRNSWCSVHYPHYTAGQQSTRQRGRDKRINRTKGQRKRLQATRKERGASVTTQGLKSLHTWISKRKYQGLGKFLIWRERKKTGHKQAR